MIDIIFQNENFVVCNKPGGVLSVPSRDRHDPRGCLGIELQRHLNQSVLPVHRLDLEVSGLIVFALNPKAHKKSQDWFEKKTISKLYIATTSEQNFSHWPEQINTIRDTLDMNDNKVLIWKTQIQRGKKRSFESTHGEWAETKAQIQTVKDGHVHWHLYPLTGKPHQLRLELSRRGFPVHGDQLYGSKVKTPDQAGISLKAVRLDLTYVPDRLGLPQQINLKDEINI